MPSTPAHVSVLLYKYVPTSSVWIYCIFLHRFSPYYHIDSCCVCYIIEESRTNRRAKTDTSYNTNMNNKLRRGAHRGV